MRCEDCGLSPHNQIHTHKSRPGYHKYVDPPEDPYVKSNEERIEELEERVKLLENHLFGEK
jgi:hypothetical protein